MQLDEITPVVLTFNEAENIVRTLDCLTWANDILVIDSGSTDHTMALATSVSSVRWEVHNFVSHAEQWNYAISKVETNWVLALDADYQVTDEFRKELAALDAGRHSAFRASFIYLIASKALRCSIYPPVIVLFRRKVAKYVQDGHTQRVVVNGKIGTLKTPLLHEDKKPFGGWLRGQWRYAELEAPKLANLKWSDARWSERLRKLILIMPFIVPLYVFIGRGGILDGWRGLRYATERLISEFMVSGHLVGYWLKRLC